MGLELAGSGDSKRLMTAVVELPDVTDAIYAWCTDRCALIAGLRRRGMKPLH